MSAALGQWRNAPLAYVLAQIRFEAITEMESKYLNEFQDSIRNKYPRFSRGQRYQFAINSDHVVPDSSVRSEPQMWDCQNPDRTKCVRVDTTSLTYMVTSYTTFEQFSEEFEGVICAFYEVVGSLFVTRLGERYVDYILPSAGKVPEDYVERPFNEAPDIGLGETTSQFNFYECQLDNGKLLIKYYRSQGKPELPPDLGPLSLEPSTIMLQDHEGASAILDTDRILAIDDFMTCNEVIKTFRDIHSDLSATFKRITKDSARKEWGEN